MILRKGERVHVIHRPFFKGDLHRHFIGQVEECDAGVARVTGYTYVLHPVTYAFTRRPEERTRIISLVSGHVITNVLPSHVNLEKLTYKAEKGFLRMTDGSSWHM